MAYTVYMHTFPNGKKYIGVTGMQPEKRWQNGKGYERQERMRRAIRKYGWENVTHTILISGLSREQAYEAEKELISRFNLTDSRNGYNNCVGGIGGSLGAILSDEARKAIANGHIGLKRSEETKKKLSEAKKGSKNPNFGKVTKEETKKKQKASFSATASTKEYKEKMSKIRKAMWDIPGYKEKQSERMKGEKNYFYGVHLCGEENPHYGMHLSEEQKENLRKSKSKPIICIETGEIYPSSKVAEKIFGVSHGAISRAVGKENKTSCGFHWKRESEK